MLNWLKVWLFRWLKIIIDWRINQRKKELAQLVGKLAQIKNELAANREAEGKALVNDSLNDQKQTSK